ncbi:glycosyl hydrolase [Helicosporidium sp. ATCC 50920]|nr:glycosyl hydrolase [Helicosporidium sp. ATCC 50920]|eukprot:KDD72847.1 glycosyl hydrolase [Helicosporidium sp. ATCC 50920]
MDLLGKSYLFYEAQRSGKLPANNRISYRGNSFLSDAVVGGYFDAGDHLKLNFPMHNAMIILGWSILEFPQAHADAGQTSYARNTLKWATDYIIACHRTRNEYVGQIGDFSGDHQYWGRPEEQTGPRPAWVWDASMPATDLLCSAASALAVAHLVYKTSDPAYSTVCLTHAEQLYALGKAKPGKYSDAYPDQTQGYTSNTYLDDLALAGAWLYKATGKQQYLADARKALQEAQYTRNPFVSWDAVFPLADLLLKSQGVANSAGVDLDWQIAHFRYSWMGKKDDGTVDPNPQIKTTPKGLAVAPLGGWGTLRYALNAAFAFVLDAKYATDSERRAESLAFAKKQLDYALGSSGRSFVVGYGTRPPVQPHHRSASCPDLPAPCGWDQFNSPAPNPQVLFGAMVAGPADNDGEYDDKRSDFKSNEVSLDFNAGYTGTLAGLIQML